MTHAHGVALALFASTALIAGGTIAHAAAGGGKTYTIALTGQNEVSAAHPAGGAGDLDATGSVTLTINPGKKQVCYDFINLTGLSTLTMAHIHKAPVLQNGAPVITLFTGTGGDLDDCVAATSAQLAQIIAKPSQYYVNVHTTEFPSGAIRSQLTR